MWHIENTKKETPVMKAKRYKTDRPMSVVEIAKPKYDNTRLQIITTEGTEWVYLTPTQARRIAAHLLKLAEMREGEKR